MVVSVLLWAGKGLYNRGYVTVRIRRPGWLTKKTKCRSFKEKVATTWQGPQTTRRF